MRVHENNSPQERLALRKSEKIAKSELWERCLEEAMKISKSAKEKKPEYRRYVSESGVRIKKLPPSKDI